MKPKTVSVLGVDYRIFYRKKQDDLKLKSFSGYCDPSNKTIVIEDHENGTMDCADQAFVERRILRHELIHAFAAECGLSFDSDWATNEEMVDFFAWQIPKMLKAFEHVGAL